jgi:HlyD family secretion protein
MDPADLQTDLDAAESRVSQFDKLLSSMDLVVAAATEQISASDAKFKYAEKEYRRKSGLAERKAVSPSELDAADLLQFESRVDWRTDQLTEQALKAMRNALSVARNEVDETRKQEQRDRDRAEIYSPVDGVVLKRIVSNRQVLAAGDSLLEIGNLRELEVEVEALTQEAARIEVGDRVEIVGAAVGDRRVGGTVRRIYPQGFKKISSLGVEQQRVLVIVAFDEGVLERLSARGIRLQSDYRLRVRIITDVHRDVVRIPRSAVFRDQEGRWQAFVVQGGIARRVTLEVGIINDFDVEVVKGISAGESVVVAPESALEDGMRVEAVKNSDRKRGA